MPDALAIYGLSFFLSRLGSGFPCESRSALGERALGPTEPLPE
jgi:hypothetical protein